MGILAVLLSVLAVIFWFGEQPPGRRLFRIVPSLVFCYFVPTLLTTFGVLPAESDLARPQPMAQLVVPAIRML